MQKLDPKAVWLFFFGGFFVLPLFVPIYFIVSLFWGFYSSASRGGSTGYGLVAIIVIVFFMLMVVLKYFWAVLTYKNYKYELRPDGFRKEHGVIWKKYVTIPYERIQNVDINRGPIARILGLSDLNIQTAGMSGVSGSYGGTSEGRLPGITPQVAEQLRDQLVARARGKGQSGV